MHPKYMALHEVTRHGAGLYGAHKMQTWQQFHMAPAMLTTKQHYKYTTLVDIQNVL